MGQEIKKYKEINNNGEYEVKEFSNGIKTKILINPSEEYINKKNILNKKMREKKEELKKKKAKEKLIQDRMRDIAIRELEKEGKL